MTPYYQDSMVTLYHGDAREVVPTLGSFNAVITDPTWPDAKADLFGKDNPEGMARSVFDLLAGKTERFVVQMGFDSDPRFLRSIPASYAFVRACWLDCARPHCKGFLLAGVDIAYVFGSIPNRDGWVVLPGMCRSSDSRGKEVAHPCPRKLQHVQWLVRYYGQGWVLDPFLGGGTTAVACKALGIPCVGIDIEAKYLDVAIDRLRQTTLDLQPGSALGTTMRDLDAETERAIEADPGEAQRIAEKVRTNAE